jgi:hypothetical protein
MPPPPDPKIGSRVSPVLEAGKHGERHDDASKKVTAPAGVAVVNFTQGFCLGPAVDPCVHRIHAEKSRLLAHQLGEASHSYRS